MPVKKGSVVSQVIAEDLEAARSNQVPRPVRVLLFDHTAELGGGEIALAELVRRLDRARVDPVVLLGSHGPLEGLLEGQVPVHLMLLDDSVVHARKDSLGLASAGNLGAVRSSLSYIRRLSRFMEQERIEVLHTNSLKASILGGIAGRLSGVQVVWHIRDRIAADYLPAKVVLLMRQMAKVIPHFVIGNSLATLATLDLPRTPTAAIASGVDLEKFFSPEDAGLTILAQETKRASPVIGRVGRICPWKGQHVFIEAAALVHARYPAARFQIIGAALFKEHDYDLELHRLTETMGLTDVLKFTGFQSDVAPLIRALDVLVHASTVAEPFGQVVVQGMACAKPVVATNGGGVRETMVDGVTGLLVPMGDASAMAEAICALLADPAMAQAMGERGRKRVMEHFTIEQSARKVTEVYERVAGRSDRS